MGPWDNADAGAHSPTHLSCGPHVTTANPGLRSKPARPHTADKSFGPRKVSVCRRSGGNNNDERAAHRRKRGRPRLLKRLNPRRVKIHRNYTVEEAAMLLGVHKNTVRSWLKAGLQPVDNRRPILILGRLLSGFLHARRQKKAQRCRPGQFYCFRCRAPKTSAFCKADYLPITPISGNLRGICSNCGTLIYRRVSVAKLRAAAGDLEVRMLEAEQRITDSTFPCLNCSSNAEA